MRCRSPAPYLVWLEARVLLIPCPHCGWRHESEFVNGGAVRRRRADDPSKMDDAAWVDALTVPPNPMGPLREKWWHRLGCGTWFAISRDTVTHEVRPDAGPPVIHGDDGEAGGWTPQAPGTGPKPADAARAEAKGTHDG